MSQRIAELAWDNPHWREAEKPLAAVLRRRQGAYRQRTLRIEAAGPRLGKRKDGSLPKSKLVVSMLPIEHSEGPRDGGPDNFLNDAVRDAVKKRLARRSTNEQYWPRSIAKDRLLRNMLSSQPVAFNFFGNFDGRPDDLLPWVQVLDKDASRVLEVRIEWAPPPEHHLSSGTAFDAWVSYEADGELGFVAVECKYAENLRSADKKKYVETYRDKVTALRCWSADSYDYLNGHGRQQFMLNVSLAQSLLAKGETPTGLQFNRGHCVVMAVDEDSDAETTTNEVSKKLETGPGIVTLTWLPFGRSVDVLAGTGSWAEDFRFRYLKDPS